MVYQLLQFLMEIKIVILLNKCQRTCNRLNSLNTKVITTILSAPTLCIYGRFMSREVVRLGPRPHEDDYKRKR